MLESRDINDITNLTFTQHMLINRIAVVWLLEEPTNLFDVYE